MTLRERLHRLASALPSGDATVTFTKASLVALLEGEPEDSQSALGRPMTVKEVAEYVGRSESSVRDWLQAGTLNGFKLNNRDWRIRPSELAKYLEQQSTAPHHPEESLEPEGDISDWRRIQPSQD